MLYIIFTKRFFNYLILNIINDNKQYMIMGFVLSIYKNKIYL